MTDSIRLGAFRLDEPLSAGGMGTVWRGEHLVTQTPVAVKVIAGTYAQDPVYLDGFEREVRAVARMHHPRIIRVYDFGFVDSGAERTSGGELPRRSPWLAMELADRGSLAQLGSVGDFETLRAILFDVLDALAHSHARNVIHRDLKPGNILLSAVDGGVRCKLTDFGISHASGRGMSTREVFASSAGTPWYMAPEQVDSRWRDYGPWTDLYALGCVAYQLASGSTPFTGNSAVRIARQQLFDRTPPLQPTMQTPPGFVAWVERLLVKEIPHRFQRAADAAWALHQIAPRSDAPILLRRQPQLTDTVRGTGTTQRADSDMQNIITETFTSEVATLTFLDEERDTARLEIPSFNVPGSLLMFSVPPMPRSWRGNTAQSDGRLPGAGLGLFQLREGPFVGRERERDRVWEVLGDVVRERTPRAVVIRGGAGVGKTRLAEWIAQRAHELGAAATMTARHSPVRGPDHGLGAMLEEYLNCGGLDYERCYLRVRRLFAIESSEPPDRAAYYAAAVTRIIQGAGEASGVPAVRFSGPNERHQVVERVAGSVADRRGLVVVIDNAQWGYDALALTARLLDSDHPILVLVTMRDDHLDQRPLERDALIELQALDNVDSIALGPLSRNEHLALIDEMLVLEPTLREEVLERTYGSPLFATEMISDWVRRRVLETGPDGFRLSAMEPIPDSLAALWNDRLDAALDDVEGDDARSSVEVGAALGRTVDEVEWREICARLGIAPPDNLIEALVHAGLAEPTERGWAFRHQMLREAIVEAAHASGRASRQHRTVAAVLEFDESADNQLRRALHHLAVKDSAGAAQPLLVSIESLSATGRIREALSLLSLLDRVLSDLDDDDHFRARSHELRLDLLYRFGDRQTLAEQLESTRRIAEEHQWNSTMAVVHNVDGAMALDLGDVERAEQQLQLGLRFATQARAPHAMASAHMKLGWMRARRGDDVEAHAHFEAARDHFQIATNIDGESSAMVGLAEAEVIRGNFDAAQDYLDKAVDLCRRNGLRTRLSAHLNQHGELASRRKDYETAERYYAESMQLAQLSDNAMSTAIARLNLGIVCLYLNRPGDAVAYLEDCSEWFGDNGWIVYQYYADLGLLWSAAATGHQADWDARYGNCLASASEEFAQRESVEHALTSGDHWISLGDPVRARQAYRLADRLIPAGYRDEVGPIVAERLQHRAGEEKP